MSQGTTIIPTTGPSSLSALISGFVNPALAALLTNNSGLSAPSSPSLFQFWLNTTASPRQLEMWDGTSWLVILTIDPTGHVVGLPAASLTGSALPAGITTIPGPAKIGVSELDLPTALLMSSGVPAVASGFGTGAAVISNNGTATFRVNVGTTPGNTGVITMPSATNGWNVQVTNLTSMTTSQFITKQVGVGSSTSVTIGNYTDVGGAGPWLSNDILAINALAF